jgi:hypothetical protein
LEVEAIAVAWQNDLLGPAPASDAVVINANEVREGDVMLGNAIAQPSQRLQGVEPVAQKTDEISRQLDEAEWLRLEQRRWGVENCTHYAEDVTYREDQSRVRHANATAVLGIFRRLSYALKHGWAIDRPRREATSADWNATFPIVTSSSTSSLVALPFENSVRKTRFRPRPLRLC